MKTVRPDYRIQGWLTGALLVLAAVHGLVVPQWLPVASPWAEVMLLSLWLAGLACYNVLHPRVRPRDMAAIPDSPADAEPPILCWTFDRNLVITHASGGVLGDYDVDTTQMMGVDAGHQPEFPCDAVADMKRALMGESFSADYVYHEATFRTRYFPVRNWLGQITRCICATVNLSRMHRVDAELALSRRIIESASDGVAVADARRRVVNVNPAFSAVTGYDAGEVIGGRAIIPDAQPLSVATLRRLVTRLRDNGAWEGEVSARRKNGEPYVAKVCVSLIRDRGRVSHSLLWLSDISKIKQEHRELHRLANYDFLTGLPNRRLFLDRLDQAVKRGRRQQRRFALYFLDLDDFKQINDTLGHHFGDQLLCQVAGRLQGATREMDTVARLSGDEFVVLVEQISGDDEVVEVAGKLLDCFQPAFRRAGQLAHCRASLGVAVFPEDGDSPDILLAVADAGMYRAKASDQDQFYFRGSHRRLAEEPWPVQPVEIARAVKRGELELHYQPQIDLRNNAITGCEVLVRWNHSEGRQLLPGQFLPLAEREDLANDVGRWVLKTAARQFQRWVSQGIHPGALAINLASSQLRDEGLLPLVDELVAAGLIRYEQLRFEVSTSQALACTSLVDQFFWRASAMGIGCVLDEFGAQEAGFELLRKLRVDMVKLDRTLIQASRGNPGARALVAAIAALGDAMGFAVIGVGVEQQPQLDSLHRSGCHLVQGYYYAPSLPVADFSRFYKSFYQQSAG